MFVCLTCLYYSDQEVARRFEGVTLAVLLEVRLEVVLGVLQGVVLSPSESVFWRRRN